MTHWLTIIQVYAFICLGGLYCLVFFLFVCCIGWGFLLFGWWGFLFFIIGGAFSLLGGVSITIQSYDLMSFICHYISPSTCIYIYLLW